MRSELCPFKRYLAIPTKPIGSNAFLAEAAAEAAPHKRARLAQVVVPPEQVHGLAEWALRGGIRIQRDRRQRWPNLRADRGACGCANVSALGLVRSWLLLWRVPVREPLMHCLPGGSLIHPRGPADNLPTVMQFK